MYDVRDIVKKAIDISMRKKTLYENLIENLWDPGVIVTIKVLIRTLENDVDLYEKIIDNVSNEMAEAIDFAVYDKISSLVNQFSKLIVTPNLHSKSEIVEFAINLEEGSYALLVDIQGRMVQNSAIASTVSYYVLTELIEVKRLDIEKLKAFR